MPWRLEFLRGNAAESPLPEADVIRDADTGARRANIWFWTLAQAGVQFLWSGHRRFFQDRACGTQNVSYKGIGATAIHFPVCVMNGASFFLIACFLERASPFSGRMHLLSSIGFSEARAPSGIKDRAFPWSLVLLCEALAFLRLACLFVLDFPFFRKSCPQIRKNGRDLRL